MDLNDWELVDFGRKSGRDFCFDEKMILEMDYFVCSSVPPATPRRIFPQATAVANSGVDVLPAAPSSSLNARDNMKTLILPDVQDALAQVFIGRSNEFVNMSLISPRTPATSRGMIRRSLSEPDQLIMEDACAGAGAGDAGMSPPMPPSPKGASPDSTLLPPRSPSSNWVTMKLPIQEPNSSKSMLPPLSPKKLLHIEPEALKLDNRFCGKKMLLSPRSPIVEISPENRLFKANSMLTPRSPSSRSCIILSPRSPVSMENQFQFHDMSTVSSPKLPCTGVVEPLMPIEQSVLGKNIISPEELERGKPAGFMDLAREVKNSPAAVDGSSINPARRRPPTGTKAIRSIGVAAVATLCIFAFGVAANNTKSFGFNAGTRSRSGSQRNLSGNWNKQQG